MKVPPGRSRAARLGLLLGLLVVVGCKARDAATIGSAENPLVVLLAPTHAGTDELRTAAEARLEEASGLALELRVAPNSEAAVQLAGSPSIDAGLVPLFDYLFARQEYGVEAALQVVRHQGDRAYTGEIVVRADGPVQTLADLEGLRVAFVDPYSTSGFLLPAKLLRDHNVTPLVLMAGTHAGALDWLRTGLADAAAVYEGAAAADPALRVLATTEPIPNEPLFFREGVPPSLRQRLAEALLGMAADPEGARLLSGLADITGFVPIGDAEYAAVHETIRASGRSVEDLVPAGWLIRNENRRTLLDFAY